MGLRPQDLTPLGVNGPTVQTPPAKEHITKSFQVARTDTTASVKAVLPASASIIDVRIFGVASNAVSTATIGLGTTSAANQIISGQDVKTAGGLVRPTTSVQSAGFLAFEPIPWTGDLQIWAQYAESGGASTVGGPWIVQLDYIP